MNKLFVIITITILLFCLPFLFWNGHLYYMVGGDDTRLYYLFPLQMIKNYAFNIISDNILSGMGSYATQAFMAPFFLLIYLVKVIVPGANTQLFFYGTNLSLGFLAFYALLGIWMKDREWSNFWLKISASFFYVFSIFSFYTLWKNQLFSLYLISIGPLILYLFFRGVIESKVTFVVGAATVLSLFSILLISAPWSLAFALGVAPLLFFLFWRNKSRFLIYACLFVGLLFLLNFYWLSHLLYSPFSSTRSNQDVLSVVTAPDYRLDSQELIKIVSGQNDVLYPLFNLYHKKIQQAWEMYPIFLQWHLKILPLNIIFPLVIFLAGFLLKKSSQAYQRLYLVALVGWLMALFFFTVKIGDWGVPIFLWLTRNIPGFVMFRNMYDKFGFALSFTYAFLFAMSLKILLDYVKTSVFKRVFLLIIVVVVLINAKPFILGEYHKSPIWTTKETYNTISGFNHDFLELVSYLSSREDAGRVVWLPLNIANYVIIQDENLINHYYIGPSPLLFLSQKNDFSGLLSFETGSRSSLSIRKKLEEDITQKNYYEIGKTFQKFNVRFVIMNKTISYDLQQSFLYGKDLYESQGAELQKALLGRKVRDFGGRYSLYEINDNFKSEKIYLTKDSEMFPEDFSGVSYKKLTSYQYEIYLGNLKNESWLVFLDPYHEQWEFRSKDGKKINLAESRGLVFDYANGWKIDAGKIKEQTVSNPEELILYFKPQDYLKISLGISGIVWIGVLAYLLSSFARSTLKSK